MKAKKKRLRLQARMKAFDYFMHRNSEHKVDSRKKAGGYKCPGSYQR